MRLLNGEHDSRYRRAGRHGKTCASAARHGISVPSPMLFGEGENASSADGGTHLHRGTFVAERNSDKKIHKRDKERAYNASQPFEGKYSAQYPDGSGNSAAFKIGFFLINKRE